MNYDIKINEYGTKFYYVNNNLHREDGPAVEFTDGTKIWYLNGLRHREDGPAIESATGYKEWWINGNLDREDGPAIEYLDGGKQWYLNNKFYGIDDKFTNKSWKKFVKTLIFS